MGKYVIGDLFEGTFPVTQEYGVNPEAYKPYGLPGHEGVDFGTPVGTPILAGFDGMVLRDGFSPKDYGNYIVLWDATQHIAVWYCHLSEIDVQAGATVARGAIIGKTGNTGHSSGPHLHINLVETDGSGNRLNMDNGYQGFLNINDPELVSWQLTGAAIPAVHAVPDQALKVVAVANVRSAPNTTSGITTILQKDAEIHIEQVVDGETIEGNDKWLQLQGQIAYIWSGATNWVPPIVVASSQGPVSATIVTQTTHSEADYQACMADRQKFWGERDQALKQVADLDSQIVTLKSTLSAFAAKGYTNVDDIDKAVKNLQEDNTNLTTEVKQLEDANSKLALLYKAKCDQNSASIDTGLNATSQAQNLQDQLQSIAGFVGTKPELKSILESVNTLMQNQKPSFKQDIVNTVEKVVESPKSFLDLFGGR